MLANRLLAQRLRLIGDGEAVLAVALVGNRAQELLGAIDETGVDACRDEQAHEQDRATDQAPELHALQYTPPFDLVPARAV
jgi:hypothetical protein